MSAYANDPRVTDLGGDVYLVTCCPGHGPLATVKSRPGMGFVTDDSPAEPFPTADDAIRSLIGGPE